MQVVKVLLLLTYVIGVTVGLRLAWQWARKRGKQFNDQHPRYVRRKVGDPTGSTEELLFASMPKSWFSSWSFAFAVALAGGLVILLDELTHH